MAGHDVTVDPRAVRRLIGVVTGDDRAWYWRLSGKQNLEFFACLNGFRRSAAATRAEDLLVQMDLAGSANKRVGTYSSGMRARLALARAFLSDPHVLLLDEPTQNLDPSATVGFREMVTQYIARTGAAVLFATHDLHEAAELASRVAVIVDGEIAFTGGGEVTAVDLEREVLAVTRRGAL